MCGFPQLMKYRPVLGKRVACPPFVDKIRASTGQEGVSKLVRT